MSVFDAFSLIYLLVCAHMCNFALGKKKEKINNTR